MSNPTLIVVHGMGQYKDGTFKHEVVTALEEAFNLYPHLAGKKVGEFVDIVPFEYDKIFDEKRKELADSGKEITEFIGGLDDMEGDFLTDALVKLASLQEKLGKDNFVNTHWFDVFLYRFTTLGEFARIKLGRETSKLVGSVSGGPSQVHMLGHSLGTTLVHDTLAKLYDKKRDFGEFQNVDQLSIRSQKLGSVHMIANVSRLLESFVKVDESLVKPGFTGCCRYYREYRHKLDPITWPKPFNPSNNGRWISRDDMHFKRYFLQRITSVTNKHGNTHDVKHYLANPDVHQVLFEKVLAITLTSEQATEGARNYGDMTLAGVADDLAEAIEELRRLNLDSLIGLINCAKEARAFVESLGGEYGL